MSREEKDQRRGDENDDQNRKKIGGHDVPILDEGHASRHKEKGHVIQQKVGRFPQLLRFERAAKEQQRTNSRAARSRYSTSGFTSKTINLPLKLPPLKAKQQVSLKTKVDTDRCFLLLNDMDINVNNCGTASMSGKVSRQGCNNLFRYVSPAGAEYYTEFKEISPEQQAAIEDAELDAEQKELEQLYNEALTAIENIASEVPAEEVSAADSGVSSRIYLWREKKIAKNRDVFGSGDVGADAAGSGSDVFFRW